jgi:hypothetical protein
VQQNVLAGAMPQAIRSSHSQADAPDAWRDDLPADHDSLPRSAHALASGSTGGSGPVPPPAHENERSASGDGSNGFRPSSLITVE